MYTHSLFHRYDGASCIRIYFYIVMTASHVYLHLPKTSNKKKQQRPSPLLLQIPILLLILFSLH
jgi:hypothetical protein